MCTKASGSASTMSPAIMPISPFWSRAMSPATPWMKTPSWAASNAGSFWARSAAITPVRTSPAAAGGHARVSGRVDVIPLSVRHDRAGPLENDDERSGDRSEGGGALDAFGLNGLDGSSRR